MLHSALDARVKAWAAFTRQAVEFHLKNASAWANAAAGADLAVQVDPGVSGASTMQSRWRMPVRSIVVPSTWRSHRPGAGQAGFQQARQLAAQQGPGDRTPSMPGINPQDSERLPPRDTPA